MTQYEPPGGAGGTAGSNLGDPETAEIRVEIEQTRTEMSGTIDAIQRKLAPDVLTEQAKDIARDATDHAKTAAQELLQNAVQEVKDAAIQVTEHAVHEVKDAAWDATVGRAEDAVSSAGETARGIGSIVIETIKQNPLPAALAGISLAWLYMRRPTSTAVAPLPYRSPGAYQGPRSAETYPLRSGYASAWTGQRPQAVPATSTPGTMSDSMSGAVGQAGELASDVASSVASGASQVATSAGNVASSAGETAMDTGSTILDIVKRNPVPAALVGIGLGWLYMNRSSGQPEYRPYSGDHARYSASGSYSSSASGSGVGDMARQAGERAGEMAGGVREQVGEAAGAVQEHVGDFAGAVKDRTVRAPGQIQRMVEENPLLTAALAAALGSAVGLALPPTQSEDQILGSTRDRVMGRAQEMTSEAIGKVQSVAQEVQATAGQEARAQGLTV